MQNMRIVPSKLKGDINNKSKTSAGESGSPVEEKKLNDIDLIYSVADGREKADMRKQYPDYNFRARKFREDMKSGINNIKISDAPVQPDPLMELAKLRRLQLQFQSEDRFRQLVDEINKSKSESEYKGLPYLMGLPK